MVDTLEKRVQDFEYIIAHLPEDLNARLAGVELRFATVREAQALHTQRFTTIERKIEGMGRKVEGAEHKVATVEGKLEAVARQVDTMHSQMNAPRTNMNTFQAQLNTLTGQMGEVLQRLPRT